MQNQGQDEKNSEFFTDYVKMALECVHTLQIISPWFGRAKQRYSQKSMFM